MGRISATMYYFPDAAMQGDIDALRETDPRRARSALLLDNSQVERVVVQKFEPGNIFSFAAPSATLAVAMDAQKPLLYVRLSKNPFEELS